MKVSARWVQQDSNLQPNGYEPRALPLSYGPKQERVTGLEPVPGPWKGHVLPLHHTRAGFPASGRPDLNRGPRAPKARALTGLRHAPSPHSSRISRRRLRALTIFAKCAQPVL